MPEPRVSQRVPKRKERPKEPSRGGALVAAEHACPAQPDCEVAKLRARVPILRNDSIHLALCLDQPLGMARHQRVNPLSVHGQQLWDADETRACGSQTKPELPILADPEPLVVTADSAE